MLSMKSRAKYYMAEAFRKAGYKIEKNPSRAEQRVRYIKYYPNESLSQKQFYNIGAGKFKHEYWTNIDMASEKYSSVQSEFINFDLESLKPLPIENNSAEIIYSSHTIEHITNAAAQNLFNEAYRALKPGGILRLTTPNIDLEYAAYLRGDRDYFYWMDLYYNNLQSQVSLEQMFVHHFASQASKLNSDSNTALNDAEIKDLFRIKSKEDAMDFCVSRCSLEMHRKDPGNHINWWNEAKARKMLKEAGFQDIYRSGYGQSVAPVLRDTSLFDNTHPKMSLYIEAIKS